MQKSKQYRHAVLGVWEQGHAAYTSWPPERQALAEPRVDALSAWLADAGSEDELIDRYMALDGLPSTVLPDHLGGAFTLTAVGAVEDECFWRRASEIGGSDANA